METKPFKWQKKMLFLIVFVPVLFTNCRNDSNQVVYDPAKPIVCESFFPDSGGVGTKLLIRGENFGTDPSLIKVVIKNKENKEAKVINVNDTRIYAVIPARADSGNICVTVGKGKDAQEFIFNNKFNYIYRRNVSTLCGGSTHNEIKDGSFKETLFEDPFWLEIDDNNLYVLEAGPKALRILDLINEVSSTPWRGAGLSRTRNMVFSPKKDTLFIGIEGGNTNVSTVFLTKENGFIKYKLYAPQNGSNATTVNPVDGEVFINNYWDGTVYHWNKSTKKMEVARKIVPNNSDFTFCWSLDGKTLFYIVREGSDHGYIGRMEYDMETHKLSESQVWVGAKNADGFQDGQGEDARFFQPNQMVAGPDGDYFLADKWNHCIRRITSNGVVSTYAGIPGSSGFTEGDPLKEAQFNNPCGLAITKDGATLYVADVSNRRICKIVVE